jgi:TDT family tellurite/dicarboxylate transporter
MAGMILSTYLFRLFPAFGGLSQLVWWFAFLLDLCLILYFTKTHVMARPRAKATPSWTVLYVGIAVAALTYPVVGVMELAYLTLGFGFILTLYLYPLIYQDLKSNPLPSHLLGQEGIYCAPFSLLLAALVRVGGASLPTWILLIMVVVSQGFYFFVLTRLPRMIKEGFQPAFSALTFPTVITATSLKMAQGLLQIPFLTGLVWMETLLCLLILVAVLGGYVVYLRD